LFWLVAANRVALPYESTLHITAVCLPSPHPFICLVLTICSKTENRTTWKLRGEVTYIRQSNFEGVHNSTYCIGIGALSCSE